MDKMIILYRKVATLYLIELSITIGIMIRHNSWQRGQNQTLMLAIYAAKLKRSTK